MIPCAVQRIQEPDSVITDRRYLASFEDHIERLEPINGRMASLANTLPKVRTHMHGITGDMATIAQSMELVGRGMGVIDRRVHAITGGIAHMREHVGQIARPMGKMMPFMS